MSAASDSAPWASPQHMVRSFISRWRSWDALRGLVFVLLILCLVTGLSDSHWLKNPSIVWWVATVSIGVGMLLSKTMRRPGPMLVALAVSGLIVISLVQSRALPPLAGGLQEVNVLARWAGTETQGRITDLLARVLGWADQPVRVPQPRPNVPEWEAAVDRMALYLFNLRAQWPPPLKAGTWDQGQLLLGTILAIMVWMAVGFSTWVLKRRILLWGRFMPVLVILALSVFYEDSGWPYLIIGILLGLILCGNAALQTVEYRWPPEQLYHWLAQEWWFFTALTAVGITAVMAIALLLTSPQLNQWIDETWHRPPSRSALSPTIATYPHKSPSGVWPQSKLLGSGVELAQQPAMFVRTPDAPPADFYWRASTYDYYTGEGWLQTTAVIPPGQEQQKLWPSMADAPSEYTLLRQDFTLMFDTQQIYAVGRPVRLSVPARGMWSDASATDLVGVRGESAVRAYQVLSWVPTSTETELRAAISEIPAGIKDQYLQVPDNLPDRVGKLAEEITAGSQTRYDQALALQDYLRTYTYSLNLPAPPPDRDVVDYFLFESKRGYCDYYATAMVIMARHIGLPARLAVGYRTGEYDEQANGYRVSRADAHSWPELYFEGAGWIPFEPTGAYPALEHGLPPSWNSWQPPAALNQPNWVVKPPQTTLKHLWLPILSAFLGGILLCGAGVAAYDIAREARRRRLPPAQVIASIYGELIQHGRWLGVGVDASRTPYEMQSVLLIALARVVGRVPPSLAARLSSISPSICSLIRLYVDGQYSPQHPTSDTSLRAVHLWLSLRWLLRCTIVIGLAQHLAAKIVVDSTTKIKSHADASHI